MKHETMEFVQNMKMYLSTESSNVFILCVHSYHIHHL